LAKIIILVILALFFKSKADLGIKREIALMFDPIRGVIVIFVTIGIYHALHEYYATRRKVISKFDNTTSYSVEISILIWHSILFANYYAIDTY
jgi:hypothetical protein